MREDAGPEIEAEALASDVGGHVSFVEDGDVEGGQHRCVAAQVKAQHRVVRDDDLGDHGIGARVLGEAPR